MPGIEGAFCRPAALWLCSGVAFAPPPAVTAACPFSGDSRSSLRCRAHGGGCAEGDVVPAPPAAPPPGNDCGPPVRKSPRPAPTPRRAVADCRALRAFIASAPDRPRSLLRVPACAAKSAAAVLDRPSLLSMAEVVGCVVRSRGEPLSSVVTVVCAVGVTLGAVRFRDAVGLAVESGVADQILKAARRILIGIASPPAQAGSAQASRAISPLCSPLWAILPLRSGSTAPAVQRPVTHTAGLCEKLRNAVFR